MLEIPRTTAPRPSGGLGSFVPGLGDGPLVALVRVQPSYPARAQARELEGYAVVEFTVLPDGTTTGHRIVESSHTVFEVPSIRAAERFRYKPRVVDGVPQATRGVRNVFRFEMDRG